MFCCIESSGGRESPVEREGEPFGTGERQSVTFNAKCSNKTAPLLNPRALLVSRNVDFVRSVGYFQWNTLEVQSIRIEENKFREQRVRLFLRTSENSVTPLASRFEEEPSLPSRFL